MPLSANILQNKFYLTLFNADIGKINSIGIKFVYLAEACLYTLDSF